MPFHALYLYSKSCSAYYLFILPASHLFLASLRSYLLLLHITYPLVSQVKPPPSHKPSLLPLPISYLLHASHFRPLPSHYLSSHYSFQTSSSSHLIIPLLLRFPITASLPSSTLRQLLKLLTHKLTHSLTHFPKSCSAFSLPLFLVSQGAVITSPLSPSLDSRFSL